ncbi:MAG: hypothetical protein HDR45_02115 [Bacteroides sp.]|nr:hypothetical protein [Bacteroides sp.]
MSNNLFYLAERSLDTRICQYLSLDNFIAQLSRREYYISRKGEFEDANEAQLPKSQRFLPTLACTIPDKKTRELIQTYDKKVERYYNLSNSFVSCWSTNDNEDYLMWKNYASTIGVCVVSTVGNFIASFKNNEFSRYNVFAAPVSYRSVKRDDSLLDMVFIKSEHYVGESEWRFLFTPKNSETSKRHNIWLPFDYNVLIDSVILSPFIQKETSRFLIDNLKDKFNIMVESSSIAIK